MADLVTADEQVKALQKKLEEAFPPEDVGFRPMRSGNGKVPAVAYIDARNVIERLNAVMGVGWSDDYETLVGGETRCKLRLKFGPEWVSRSDVGCLSEQPDIGDRIKAAHSDALKRAAVKFGVGLYLYRIRNLYGEWDAQKKQWSAKPQLPTWAIPQACLPCGEKMGEKVVGLIREAAGYLKRAPAEYANELLNQCGEYKPGTKWGTVELRDAQEAMRVCHAAIVEGKAAAQLHPSRSA